jgi:hypothetical protein
MRQFFPLLVEEVCADVLGCFQILQILPELASSPIFIGVDSII